MKSVVFFTILSISSNAFSAPGPKNLGSVVIGMSKAEYLATTGSSAVNCNTFRDKDGKPRRSELKYLTL